MTLRLVKDGKPETDPEVRKVADSAMAAIERAVETGGVFWLIAEADGEVSVSYLGGKLEASALAEVIAGEAKREALGL
jgi:hypothetical protein